MENTILVPIDGSDHSRRALKFAVHIAKGLQAKVIVLNVQLSLNTRNVKRFISQDQIREYQEEEAQDAISKVLDIVEGQGLEVVTKFRIGAPDAEICKEAEEEQVTSIVMGTRGLGAFKRNILGSVSYSVLQEAPCPVTVVP
ncbi:universal stress protein [Schinkia sp. CFF1]